MQPSMRARRRGAKSWEPRPLRRQVFNYKRLRPREEPGTGLLMLIDVIVLYVDAFRSIIVIGSWGRKL